MNNPFLGLLHSRKFLLLMLDAVIGSVMLFLADNPVALDKFVKFYALWQPMLLAVVAAIAYEDKAKIQAQADLDTATMYESGAKIKAEANLLNSRAATMTEIDDDLAGIPVGQVQQGGPV